MMRNLDLVLAGLAVCLAGAAPAASGRPADRRAHLPARADAGAPAAASALSVSAEAQRVAAWIAASGDNQGLPYLIVDKKQARLLLFDRAGVMQGDQPVLLGLALGDRSTPGVGSKNLAELGPAEKTTPAGRFLARFGRAVGRQQVLWVDYANSVALHPIPATVNPREQRRQRMLSPTGDDNRITFGCINVPAAIYRHGVRPLFHKHGGYVYVLPDELALEEVFPLLRTQPLLQAHAAPPPPPPPPPPPLPPPSGAPDTANDLAR